jgi:hypothetical protein
MARHVPVLGQDHRLEVVHEGVDGRDDLVAARDGERAAGAEVVLHVHDEQRLGRVAHDASRLRLMGKGAGGPPQGFRRRGGRR